MSSTVTTTTEIKLDFLVGQIANQLEDEDVLAFLADLDEAMASWDFTAKAAEVFVRTSLKLDEDLDGKHPRALEALANVAEFLRQAELQPHVKGDQPILTVWTDPQAQSAALTAHDLAKLIELAAISLAKEDKP